MLRMRTTRFGSSIALPHMLSAALMQSQLTHDLPPAVEAMYPGLETDAQRAIAFVRSLPVASALVGMRLQEHLAENLRSVRALTPVPAIRS